MSIILKGKVNIWVQTALIKTSGLKGISTTAQGSGRTHTTCAHGGSGGRLLGWDEDCWGGHLRLFKQISEEYQSLKTLREMLLVCSPAAEAFVSPRETILLSVKGRKGNVSKCKKVPALLL